MQVGEPIDFSPDAFSVAIDCAGGERIKHPQVLHGYIEYIHPDGRYYVAAAHLNGHVIREAYKITKEV
jgi:hypothetical protein